MTPSDGVERESAEDVHARQTAEKIAANDERQLRLGHVEPPKKPKSKAKAKEEESKESEA